MDRDGERRWEDRNFLTRVSGEVAWWWEHNGWLRRIVFLVGVTVALGTCAFNAGVGAEYVRGQWEGIPGRVNQLEQYRDTATTPAIGELQELQSRVDSIAVTQETIQGGLERFGEAQEELRDIAEWNNCLLRVEAGQEDVSNCGPGG